MTLDLQPVTDKEGKIGWVRKANVQRWRESTEAMRGALAAQKHVDHAVLDQQLVSELRTCRPLPWTKANADGADASTARGADDEAAARQWRRRLRGKPRLRSTNGWKAQEARGGQGEAKQAEIARMRPRRKAPGRGGEASGKEEDHVMEMIGKARSSRTQRSSRASLPSSDEENEKKALEQVAREAQRSSRTSRRASSRAGRAEAQDARRRAARGRGEDTRTRNAVSRRCARGAHREIAADKVVVSLEDWPRTAPCPKLFTVRAEEGPAAGPLPRLPVRARTAPPWCGEDGALRLQPPSATLQRLAPRSSSRCFCSRASCSRNRS